MLDVVALLLHAYVYGAEPPVGADCAVPLPPLQSTLAVTVALDTKAAGAVIVTLPVAEQLCASVTVTVYVLAVNPVAVAFVFPPGVQL